MRREIGREYPVVRSEERCGGVPVGERAPRAVQQEQWRTFAAVVMNVKRHGSTVGAARSLKIIHQEEGIPPPGGP